jgi:DNA-binding CsgD family transcriptional regulator
MIAGVSRRVSSPRFIGRQSELRRLGEALSAAAGGEPSLVLIAGEAGVGKTRLIDEFAGRVRAEGNRVLTGGCLELGEEGLPFAPIVEALRALIVEVGRDAAIRLLGPGRADLVRLAPGLGDAEPSEDVTGQGAQSRLFEHILGLLARLGVDRPLVFVLEDIHWADRSTRDLLLFLVRNLHAERVLAVATYRSDELHRRHPLRPLLSELGRHAAVEQLELGRFDRDELAEQIAAILDAPPDGLVVDQLYVRSDGNPFFAEELVASGVDATGRLPATLQEIITARVDRLAEPSRDVIRTMSVIGRRADHDLLARLTGRQQLDFLEAVREAVDERLIMPTDGTNGPAYEFRHGLVAEALYDDLLPAERTTIHGTLAALLEADAAVPGKGGRQAEIAHHWYRAHENARALPAAIRAADAALAVFAFAEAHAQLERVLELWDSVDDAGTLAGTGRTTILERAADAAAAAGELGRAIALGRTAREALTADEDVGRRLDLSHRIAWYQWDHGDAIGAERTVEDALAMGDAAPPVTRARLLSDLAQLHWSATRYAAQVGAARDALGMALIARDDAEEARARLMLGLGEAMVGDFSAGIGELERAMTALESGPEDLRSWAGVEVTHSLINTGHHRRAIEIGSAEVDRLRANGTFRRYGTYVLTFLIDALIETGRWDEASALIDDPDWPREGSRASAYIFEELVELACRRGDLDRAHASAEAVRQRVSPTDAVFDRIWLARVEAILARTEGRLGDASRHFWAAIELAADPVHDVPLGCWVIPLALTTEADRAQEARARRDQASLDDALVRGRRLVNFIEAIVAEATVESRGPQLRAFDAHGRAEALRLHGQPDPAAWASAAQEFDALDEPWDAAFARYREAEAVLLQGGDRTRATDALRAAHATADALGAGPLLADIRALATRARIELAAGKTAGGHPVAEPGGPYGLSAREREVLALVAVGRTNREIGEALFISDKTASVHVTHILDKLGVSSRVEAALLAARAGLVEPSRDGMLADVR